MATSVYRLPLLAAVGLCFWASSCAPFSKRSVHEEPYRAEAVPEAPDYEDASSWAALPTTQDLADDVLEGSALPDRQAEAAADVFFLYPTIYTDAPAGRFPWNASVTDAALNERIDGSTIRFQASVFNAAGRVYAPRYRQAHISAYYTADTATAAAAFDTAYADVKRAFDVFLRKHNQGRPIIIAGHSQGTTHAKRLVREYFDGTPLAQRLVAAYLVGIPVPPDYFAVLPVCTDAEQIGCFVSWRTWQRPATPWNPNGESSAQNAPQPAAIVVNPLSWTTADTYVPAQRNPGGTLRKFKVIEQLASAEVHDGILWIDRPDFLGKRIIKMSNWHAADYNLFYESVRVNAAGRVDAYASK